MPTNPAICAYGIYSYPLGTSTVQIINNIFPNRSGVGEKEIHFSTQNPPVVNGNTDGN